MPSSSLIPNVEKIAVLRANAIGDFIFTLPALEAVRAVYPTAEIVLIAKEWHRDFLAERPGPVDRVEVTARMEGVGALPGEHVDRYEIERFFERMKAERFDVAVSRR